MLRTTSHLQVGGRSGGDLGTSSSGFSGFRTCFLRNPIFHDWTISSDTPILNGDTGIPGWIPTNQGIHMKPHATCHLTLGRKAVCPWFTTVSHDWTSTHCKNAMVFRTLGEDGWSLQELLLVQDIGTRRNLGPSSCRIHHEESRRWCYKWLGTLRRLSLAFCEEDLLCVRSFQFLSNKLIKNSIFFS